MSIRLWCSLLGAFICNALPFYSQAQTAPDFGPAFPQQEVTSIYVTINADSLEWMLATLENEHEFPASFVFVSEQLTDTVELVGMRLRGNTSLNAAKKSLKISFNAFNAGGDWQNLEKLNLLATVNDPSLVRSKLAHDLFRKAGIAAARTSYTKLFINNEYFGVYLNVEHIDERMTATHFDGQGDGNLYKCTYPADLNFISNNPDDYKFALWGQRHYDLSTNEYLDDYSDLANFIAILNNSSNQDFSCLLPDVFHVSDYLKIAAIDVLLGNWDNHIFLKNNFYLYHHQLTDRIHFIPYDLDNTLGIDWIGVNWANRSIYEWAPQDEERPLYTRLLEHEAYRDLFSSHIEELCNTHFHPDTLALQIEYWQNLLEPHVAADPFYSLDFGYDINDFLEAPWESCCDHVPLGIIPYAAIRRAFALEELQSYGQPIDFSWIVQRVDTNAVQLNVKSAGTTSSIQANFSWDGIAFNSGTMTNTSDDYFEYSGPLFNTSEDKLFYRAIVNGTSLFPCAPQFHWMTRSPIGIRINEVCASNQSLFADEFGEYNDWVELYNTTDNSISMVDCYLTDNPGNWNRWKLPDTLLPANSYMIFWLDDDPEQGRHHANFKLGSNEELLLYRLEEGKPRIIDRASGFSSVADQTWALLPDGGSDSAFTSGTPAASNTTSGVSIPTFDGKTVYPCPANSSFYSPSQKSMSLYDLNGRLLQENVQYGYNDCSHLDAGVYVLQSERQTYRLVVTH
jgi:hypothetical protein